MAILNTYMTCTNWETPNYMREMVSKKVFLPLKGMHWPYKQSESLWQSSLEIEYYSVTYFNRVTAFKVQYL